MRTNPGRTWLLVLTLTACRGDDPVEETDPSPTDIPLDTDPVSAPAEPPPPEGISHEGGTLFSLNTTTRELPAVQRDAPADAQLVGILADQGGKRGLVLRIGGSEHLLAAPGWHLPPVGAWSGDRAMFCWNTLTGPESAPGAMPHPSAGLALTCRIFDGSLSANIQASPGEAPAWLVDLRAEAEVFTVTAYVNAAGWLFGPAAAGDGRVTRRYVDGAWVPVE